MERAEAGQEDEALAAAAVEAQCLHVFRSRSQQAVSGPWQEVGSNLTDQYRTRTVTGTGAGDCYRLGLRVFLLIPRGL